MKNLYQTAGNLLTETLSEGTHEQNIERLKWDAPKPIAALLDKLPGKLTDTGKRFGRGVTSLGMEINNKVSVWFHLYKGGRLKGEMAEVKLKGDSAADKDTTYREFHKIKGVKVQKELIAYIEDLLKR